MQVEGKGSQHVAEYTGKYTPEQSAMYAKACMMFITGVQRIKTSRCDHTELQALADQSPVALHNNTGAQGVDLGPNQYRSHGTPQFLLQADDTCVDLVGEAPWSSPLQLRVPCLVPAASAIAAKGSTR